MMKRKILSVLLLPFMLSAVGCGSEEKSGLGYTQISIEQAKEMMKAEKNYIILDVRRLDEFGEKHIPDAICVPNEEIGEDEIPALPDKSQLILVYCRSGRRSKEACAKLVALGYTNLYEFGGIIDWDGDLVYGDR